MGKSDNLHDFFLDLANAIRTREGSTEPIYPRDMARRVAALGGATIDTAPRKTLKATLVDIANAIRVIEGSSGLINPQNMSDRIMAIVSIKPYLEVEYIESTGTQFIDTGVVLTSNHSVEIDYQLTEATQNRKGLFGGLFDGSLRYGMLLSPSNNYLEFGYGSGNTYWQFGLPDTNRHIMKQERNEVYFDGELLYTFKEGIFAVNKSAPLGNFAYTNYNPAKARYYSAKIWDGNKLIRDFIPALDSGGVACMYDKVSNNFFYNQGTGNFKVGHLYKELEYIESTGTQYIDADYIPNNTTEIELGVSGITNNSFAMSSGTWFLGARQAYLNRAYGFYYNPSQQNFYYAFGNNMPSAKYTTLYNAYKTIKTNATGLYVDGTKVVSATVSTFTAPVSLSLFGLNNNGSTISFTNFKMHYCKIWDNGTLVRDFIPVLDYNNVACLYDKVSGEFFYNKGDGEFIAGNKES